jgi:hypothetical protein
MAIGNSNASPSGLIKPTTTSYTPGSGNPRDSAIASNANMNSKQSNLSAIGGRRKSHKGGASPPVAVPQMQMPYTPTGGPGTNPNDQISGLSSTGMQSAAWKVNDNQASKMGGSSQRGGSRKKRKGGSNLNWGCLSGGFSQSKGSKRRRTRRRTRTTKRRRTRRRHR